MNTSHSSKRNGPPQVVHQPRGRSSVVNPAYQQPPHLPQYQQPIIPQPAQPYLPYPTIPPAVQGEGNIVLYYVPPYHMCIMYVLPHK
jgi:hypothetical protein